MSEVDSGEILVAFQEQNLPQVLESGLWRNSGRVSGTNVQNVKKWDFGGILVAFQEQKCSQYVREVGFGGILVAFQEQNVPEISRQWILDSGCARQVVLAGVGVVIGFLGYWGCRK